MQPVRFFGRLAVAVAAICLALPAFADIRSFNAAMQTKDYRKAAAEAAATWPTLDKSRPDIALIAHEFGFAAFMASDYAAARTFGTAAFAGATDNESRIGSELLLRLSEFKLTPSESTRDNLFTALEASAKLPGIDLLTYIGLDNVMSRDFDEADWKRGAEIAALGEAIVSRGSGANSVQSFRFGLSKYVGQFMQTAKVEPYRRLIEMRRRLIEVINAAASDEEVNGLVQFYWGLEAWRISISSQLEGWHRLFGSDRDDPDSGYRADDRAVRLLNLQTKDKPCQTEIGLRWKPTYPSDARYKGMIGTVMLRADIDERGHATNPKILAAVPKDVFGKTVLSTLSQLSLSPGRNWGPACALAREGKVITFVFAIR